jgi:XTP/dITP diphosphohydrolase
MFTLHFATTNKGKIVSLKRDLSGLDVELVPIGMDIPEIRADETPEIARRKVEYAYYHLKQPCIAQDGGFYIPSLNGFPKAYVNFAISTIGLEGLLKLVEGKDRHCEFRDTLAFMDAQMNEPMLFTAVTRGMLADTPRGELKQYHWGELHKVFIPESQIKTFTEMTEAEMDSWRAGRYEDWCGRQFARWLKRNRL